MSKFSIFMKANKKVRKNEKYAPTASLTDEDGQSGFIRVQAYHIEGE